MTMPRAAHLDALAREMLPLVRKVAGQVARRVPPQVRDDLAAQGMLGLAVALARFTPEQAANFRTYAICRIRGEILDELRRRDPLSRDLRLASRRVTQASQRLDSALGRRAEASEVAAQAGLSAEVYGQLQTLQAAHHPLSNDEVESWLPCPSPTPEEALARQQQRRRLARAIEQLPRPQRLVLWLYYFSEMPLGDIASRLGVTAARVCQIRLAAVTRLRESMTAEA